MNYYLLHTKKQLGDGLYGLKNRRWGRQLWSIVKVQKKHRCVITGELIEKGSLAYRPITDRGNRYERIAKAFFEANK